MWLVGCSPFFLLVSVKKKPFPNFQRLYLVLLNGCQRVPVLYSRCSNHHQFLLFFFFFFSFLSLLVDCVENTAWHWCCALDRDELINVGTEWTGFSPCRLWPFHAGTLLKDYCKHSRPFHINEELHFMLSHQVFPVSWFFLVLLPFCLTAVRSPLLVGDFDTGSEKTIFSLGS